MDGMSQDYDARRPADPGHPSRSHRALPATAVSSRPLRTATLNHIYGPILLTLSASTIFGLAPNYIATGRIIVLLTVFTKTRARAEIDRARRALQRCITDGYFSEEQTT